MALRVLLILVTCHSSLVTIHAQAQTARGIALFRHNQYGPGAAFTMSGAGTSAANGDYFWDGTFYLSQPRYVKYGDNTYVIVRALNPAQNGWRLRTGGNTGTALYSTGAGVSLSGPWGNTGSGDDPPPTYTGLPQGYVLRRAPLPLEKVGETSVISVANAAERLSLSPSLTVGTQVFQIDNSTTYQLAAPSTVQGGVFVSGGTQDGIQTLRGAFGGKPYFIGLGLDDSPSDPSISSFSTAWFTDRWQMSVDGEATYYSLSDVATPDLASNWKNASDDSPASITVTSVTSGQLAAGFTYNGNVYSVNGNSNGRNKYSDVLGVQPDFTWDGTKWTDGTHNGTGNTAFPCDVTGITITRDDVAAEANWEVVP